MAEQLGEAADTVNDIPLIKYTPKRRKIDPAWDFINEINNKRYCKICNKEYSKETGLTTIKGHSKFGNSQTNHVEPYGKKDEKKVEHLIELLIQWIITDQQAFSVVDNADFLAFIAALDQRFQLPTRQAIAESILDLYNYPAQKPNLYYIVFSRIFHSRTLPVLRISYL